MGTGLPRLFKERFPEMGEIDTEEMLGMVTQITKVKIGQQQKMYRVNYVARDTIDTQHAIIKLKSEIIDQQKKNFVIPANLCIGLSKFRKLTELIFRRTDMVVDIYTPKTRGDQRALQKDK